MQSEYEKLLNRYVEAEKKVAMDSWFSTKFELLLAWFGTKRLREAYAKEGATAQETQKVYDAVYDRYMASVDKRIKEAFADYGAVIASATIDKFTVVVEWKRSKTWGHNPHVTLKVPGEGKHTATASGCGYDKESTAVAEALNKSPAVRKILYRAKAFAPVEYSNADIFGYGITGVLPSFSGGVGMSSLERALSRAGYSCSSTSTASVDVYVFERSF
jgi:hypothetical protein